MVKYWYLITHLGLGWIWFRVYYALCRKSGALRRATAPRSWDSIEGNTLASFVRPLPSADNIGGDCVGEAEAILNGKFRLFEYHEVAAGFPPAWHKNQLSGEQTPIDHHWSELGDFNFGDIKGVWELSRFGWSYPLVRAWAYTRDERFARGFWSLWADWYDHNSPNQGANWMCGQEATFRLMATVFAIEHLPASAEQNRKAARFFRATGSRIASNLSYALSQKNNHGISECVGLITAALLVPEYPVSSRWLRRGSSELKSQCRELVYSDGSFAQHSSVYHRVLLNDLAWVIFRLRLGKQPVPAWLIDTARRAHSFVSKLIDPLSGEVPLFGTNDGAHVLPLADGAFLDMRSAIRAIEGALGWQSSLPPGAWDEAAAWLATDTPEVGANVTVSETEILKDVDNGEPASSGIWHAIDGGYLDWRKGDGDRVFLRCPTHFRHRPSQADMLHVDIWLDGRAITSDGGSYSYNSKERFTALAEAAHHNVVTVAGLEPLKKFSRFLYLPWPKGHSGPIEEGSGWEAMHDAYAPVGVSWTRQIRCIEAGWRITDRIVCDQPQTMRWHWRLVDEDWQLMESQCQSQRGTIRWRSSTPPRVNVVRKSTDSAFGWCSRHYSAVETAVSLLLELDVVSTIELHTEFTRPVSACDMRIILDSNQHRK